MVASFDTPCASVLEAQVSFFRDASGNVPVGSGLQRGVMLEEREVFPVLTHGVEGRRPVENSIR